MFEVQRLRFSPYNSSKVAIVGAQMFSVNYIDIHMRTFTKSQHKLHEEVADFQWHPTEYTAYLVLTGEGVVKQYRLNSRHEDLVCTYQLPSDRVARLLPFVHDSEPFVFLVDKSNHLFIESLEGEPEQPVSRQLHFQELKEPVSTLAYCPLHRVLAVGQGSTVTLIQLDAKLRQPQHTRQLKLAPDVLDESSPGEFTSLVLNYKPE
jgi:hypothetical protein